MFQFNRLAASAAAIALLAPVTAFAQQTTQGGSGGVETLVLDPIVVDTLRDAILQADGYVPEVARTATKTDTPLVRVPQSVSTVTQKQLEDQKPTTVNEALSYTPGTHTTAYGFDPRFDAFFIRGFQATYSALYLDGLRLLSSPTGLFRTEPYGLESMTVLKGPSSTLYGASNAGGIVDLTSKRPMSESFHEVEMITGSNNRFQGNFDFSGPLNEDGSLLYRLTGVVRDSDTEIDGFPDNRTFIAPAVTWRGENSTLTVLGEYMDSTVGGTAVYINDENGATDVWGGHEDYNDFGQQQARIGYEFSHHFSDSLTFRQNARYAWLDNDLQYAYYQPYPTTQLAGRNAETVRSFGVDNQLEWKGSFGEFDHTVLLGSDMTWVEYKQSQGYGFLPGDGPTPGLDFTAAQEQTNYGVYAQDQVTWGAWTLVAGARYDWLSGDSWKPDPAGDDRLQIGTEDEAFSGRVGLSYLTKWGIAPYVSYATGFTLNVGMLQDGSPAAPTSSEQTEVGVKYYVPGYNATITASLFDIQQTDGVVFVVDETSGNNVQVQNDLHAQGFELEGRASLTDGLSVIASYAYVDMEIEKGRPGTIGNTLSATPFHTASIWADYTFQSGSLKGFGLGGGLRYVGMSFGNDENTIKNEPRVLLDAALHYDLGELDPDLEGTRLQLNATNLLDSVEQTCAAGYCYWDKGRTVMLSIRHRW